MSNPQQQLSSLTDAVSRLLDAYTGLKDRNRELQQRLEATEEALNKERQDNSHIHNQSYPSPQDSSLTASEAGRAGGRNRQLHRPSQILRTDTMETLDVKLGGRSYPLTLSPEEVDVVRAAAQAVEAQIAQLKSQYAITDRIDLMAMAALQIAVQAQSNAPQPAKGSADAAWSGAEVEDLLQRIQKALEG